MVFFQATVQWLNYSSKYTNGIVEAPPRFHEFPEKWPIRENEGTAASYSRRIELVLSLEVLGYFKEKRVRNDLINYAESMERDGVLTRNVKEGYVMKNDPFRKQMLVSHVVVPIEDAEFVDDQLDEIGLTTISYFQLRRRTFQEKESDAWRRNIRRYRRRRRLQHPN